MPAALRTAAAALVLFAVSGYGATRLLLPATLREHLALFVLPIGAAASMLALTLLGLLHVPLPASLAIVLAAGVALGVHARRRTPAPPRTDPVTHLAVPLALTALVVALSLVPSFRGGFITVQGQNGDAVMAAGTAELLRHAPPTAVQPELPLDRVPLLWRSKLPIYYGLAATSELAAQPTYVAFSTMTALAVGLAALGFALFAIYGVGAPAWVGALVLFAVGLDRMVLHGALGPFYNQAWALFALPYVLLFACTGAIALAAGFTALALFTYPLLLPFPAVFLGVIAWQRRGEIRVRPPRLPWWGWALIALPAVPVALVLVRGVVEKIVPAVDALRPGGDLSGWSGPALPYLPPGQFVGVEGSLIAAAILVAAVLGLRVARREVAIALGVLVGGALLAALYLRARGQAELFYFKDLTFAGPLVLTLAVVGLAMTTRARWIALALLFAAVTYGTSRQVDNTFEQLTPGLLSVRDWDRELPARQSIRIDVPPSGWQLWSWYMLAGHRVSARRPLFDVYPHPPQSRRADLVLVQRWQGRPRDAIGRPVKQNPEYLLFRLKPNLPGPDYSSRALTERITRITF